MKAMLAAIPCLALMLAACSDSGNTAGKDGKSSENKNKNQSSSNAAKNQPAQPKYVPPAKAVIDDNALPIVSITTDKGIIVMELFEDDAPNTVANFINLIEKGYYDGLTFHRFERNFMIQGGDPKGNGNGGPGYCIKDEISKRRHDGPGVLSMAKRTPPNTGGSQFFITHLATPHLDGIHTVFGRVTQGQDVVDALRAGDKMTKVAIAKKRSHAYQPETIQ
jgi:peptidyl-prolyl cis-trans isomerase B (cyclophilin B)